MAEMKLNKNTFKIIVGVMIALIAVMVAVLIIHFAAPGIIAGITGLFPSDEPVLEEEEKGLKRLISKTLEKRETREKVAVSKKKYVLLGFWLGIFGGHRFYAKQYVTATIYLLLFWTGISISMTLIDLMIVAPMKADENGNIML